MEPERWARVRELFDAAVDLDPAARDTYLTRECGADRSLLSDVRAMIAAIQTNPGFMESPVLSESQADLMEGRTVGKYKLLRRLATGGMGSVYAAARTDQEYQKVVAVKIVKPGMDSEEIIRRFRTERQVLASLEHPNIARLLDGGTTDAGLPYLVMEYVEGLPIDEYCNAHELTVTARIQLFLGVCSAVQYAHQNLVIHRDLKPSNILVTPDGLPKLLDFGIAKLIKPEYAGQPMLITRLDARPMTPEYASPEQVLGQPVTTASDLYALGVLLYRLLTGHPPYELKTYAPTEIEKAICETPPATPSAAAASPLLKKQLRGDVDVILLCALRKDPSRRYSSVQHLADDLRRHLNGLPVNARGDSWRYRTAKFITRYRAGVALAALFVVTLIAASAVSIYYARAAEQQKQMALQLSQYLLFDFDTAVRSGLTPARKAFLQRMLDHLKNMPSSASSDPAVRRLMIAAYFRIGDIQGDLYDPNLGDLAGASDSYRQALELSQIELTRSPSSLAAQRDFGAALRRLGAVADARGDRASADEYYKRSDTALAKVYDADPSSSEALQNLMKTRSAIGNLQHRYGNFAGALATFQSYLALAEHSAQGGSSNARRDVAYGREQTGLMLAGIGSTDDGIRQLRIAVSAYEQLLKESPDNDARRTDFATSSLILARVLASAQESQPAANAFRAGILSLERLAKGDPENLQYSRDLAAALSELAQIEASAGRSRDAHQLMVRAVAYAEPLASRDDPAVHDLHGYAWILLTSPDPTVKNPQKALRAARTAVRLTKEQSPAVLDLLARALFDSGDRNQAAQVEQKAVSLLPPGPSTDRSELEGNLAKFNAAVAAATTPPAPRRP